MPTTESSNQDNLLHFASLPGIRAVFILDASGEEHFKGDFEVRKFLRHAALGLTYSGENIIRTVSSGHVIYTTKGTLGEVISVQAELGHNTIKSLMRKFKRRVYRQGRAPMASAA